jgi:hypothetical protein
MMVEAMIEEQVGKISEDIMGFCKKIAKFEGSKTPRTPL